MARPPIKKRVIAGDDQDGDEGAQIGQSPIQVNSPTRPMNVPSAKRKAKPFARKK